MEWEDINVLWALQCSNDEETDMWKGLLDADDRVTKCPDAEKDMERSLEKQRPLEEDLVAEAALVGRNVLSDFFVLPSCFYRYIPAVVDHTAGLPCQGTFLLHQVLRGSKRGPRRRPRNKSHE